MNKLQNLLAGFFGLLSIFTVGLSNSAAGPIYVINDGVSGHGMVQSAIMHLNTLGHTATTGSTLADYSGYDQVWDLRYSGNLTASDVTSMGNYLAEGGRMYLTGEHSGFDSSRNLSLLNWINAVGGGNVTFSPGFGDGSERFTMLGDQLLNNNPNFFDSVTYGASRLTATSGNGFLVTEVGPGSGVGSLLGWDFGDIVGASNSRMLIGFDIEIFYSGQNWTENMYTYLAQDAAPVPEPGTILLLGSGLGAVIWRKRRGAK